MLLVLKVTRRPSASVLIAAASLAFEVSPQEATAFGQRLTAAFAYCHQKKKSCTSGKKLSPAVYRVVCALGGRSSSPRHSLASRSHQDLASPCDHSHSSATPRSRARTPTTRAEILKMYQAESHTASRELPASVDREEIFHISSQEDVQAVASGSASSSTAQAGDNHVQVTKTLVQAGPYGFAQGVFPGHTRCGNFGI